MLHAITHALPPPGASGPTPPAGTAPAGTGFAQAMSDAVSGAVDSLRAAETASSGAMTGTVGTREAVDRVMEAERTLRAAVAVRDKLVSGWLDISRMQI